MEKSIRIKRVPKRKTKTRASTHAPSKPNCQKPQNGRLPVSRSQPASLSPPNPAGNSKKHERTPRKEEAKQTLAAKFERDCPAARTKGEVVLCFVLGAFVCSCLVCALSVLVLCSCQCGRVSCFLSLVNCPQHSPIVSA